MAQENLDIVASQHNAVSPPFWMRINFYQLDYITTNTEEIDVTGGLEFLVSEQFSPGLEIDCFIEQTTEILTDINERILVDCEPFHRSFGDLVLLIPQTFIDIYAWQRSFIEVSMYVSGMSVSILQRSSAEDLEPLSLKYHIECESTQITKKEEILGLIVTDFEVDCWQRNFALFSFDAIYISLDVDSFQENYAETIIHNILFNIDCHQFSFTTELEGGLPLGVIINLDLGLGGEIVQNTSFRTSLTTPAFFDIDSTQDTEFKPKWPTTGIGPLERIPVVTETGTGQKIIVEELDDAYWVSFQRIPFVEMEFGDLSNIDPLKWNLQQNFIGPRKPEEGWGKVELRISETLRFFELPDPKALLATHFIGPPFPDPEWGLIELWIPFEHLDIDKDKLLQDNYCYIDLWTPDMYVDVEELLQENYCYIELYIPYRVEALQHSFCNMVMVIPAFLETNGAQYTKSEENITVLDSVGTKNVRQEPFVTPNLGVRVSVLVDATLQETSVEISMVLKPKILLYTDSKQENKWWGVYGGPIYVEGDIKQASRVFEYLNGVRAFMDINNVQINSLLPIDMEIGPLLLTNYRQRTSVDPLYLFTEVEMECDIYEENSIESDLSLFTPMGDFGPFQGNFIEFGILTVLVPQECNSSQYSTCSMVLHSFDYLNLEIQQRISVYVLLVKPDYLDIEAGNLKQKTSVNVSLVSKNILYIDIKNISSMEGSITFLPVHMDVSTTQRSFATIVLRTDLLMECSILQIDFAEIDLEYDLKKVVCDCGVTTWCEMFLAHSSFGLINSPSINIVIK